MVQVIINLNKCIEHNLSISAYSLLYELAVKNDFTLSLYDPKIIDELLESKLLISKNPYILSDKALEIIGVKSKFINPREFIDLFPTTVGIGFNKRPLRAKSHESLGYTKLCEEYLLEVNDINTHKKICKIAQVYVKNELKKNNGVYIPSLLKIIKEHLWDLWEDLENNDIIESDEFKSL